MSNLAAAEPLYQKALSLMAKRRFAQASKVFEHNIVLVRADWRMSWDLGWCYFKLERFDEARAQLLRATRLAPEDPICRWALGNVYLKKGQFKKAEGVLEEALRIKGSHLTRVALALAYLSRGKVAQAEATHLDGIRLGGDNSEPYDSYAAFLEDVGRGIEARKMRKKARELRRGK